MSLLLLFGTVVSSTIRILPPPQRTIIGNDSGGYSYGGRRGSIYKWPPYGPEQAPSDFLDYGYYAAMETENLLDPIQEVTLAIKPSGSGEMTASNLSIQGGMVAVWMLGGYPGRPYTVRLEITTMSTRVFERFIFMNIDSTLAPCCPVAPVSSDFGTELTATAET